MPLGRAGSRANGKVARQSRERERRARIACPKGGTSTGGEKTNRPLRTITVRERNAYDGLRVRVRSAARARVAAICQRRHALVGIDMCTTVRV